MLDNSGCRHTLRMCNTDCFSTATNITSTHLDITVHCLSTWFQTFVLFRMFYSLFWEIPWLLNFTCRRFGTLCPIFIGRVNSDLWRWECSETSAHKIQAPGNRPNERIQHCLSCYLRQTMFCNGMWTPLHVLDMQTSTVSCFWSKWWCLWLHWKILSNSVPIVDVTQMFM